MNNATLKLEERKAVGGGKAKRLRKNGYIPAVVYGHEMTPVAVQIQAGAFREFLAKSGRNSVFTTEFAAEQDFSALVKEIQYDAVRHEIIHVDLQKVSPTERVRTEVPVRVTGREAIEKGGGVVVHQLNEIAVECLAKDVPAYLEANTAGMTPGHSVTAAQLKLPPGVSLVTDPRSVVLTVTGGGLDLKVSKTDEAVVPKGKEGDVQAKSTAVEGT